MYIAKYRSTLAIVATLAVTAGPLAAPLAAQTPADSLVPFSQFVGGLKKPTPQATLGGVNSRVKSSAALEEMRQHLLKQYSDVAVAHSFVENEQTFDCVPVAQQPGVRLQGLKTIAAPPLTAPSAVIGPRPTSETVSGPTATQSAAGGTDKFGNAQTCAKGAIPMRRVTMQELARFENLQKFFEKGPNGAGRAVVQPQSGPVPPAVAGHRYAHAYQWVNNYGGYGKLALYRPYVNTALTEIFSLSQQWYVGGSGSGLQTAEVGLQNYPALYGSQNSALFIYYTADNYNKTGCYNLTCGAFVQTNGNWHLGGGFSNYSTVGGTQYSVALGFYLYNGNWWLAAGSDWVGYYPGSIFKGGQLSRYAQIFDMGGETVGNSRWPGMGSGQWSSTGWTKAAYHRNIKYRNSANAGFTPSLTKTAPSPSCYSITTPTWGGADWQTYFFFGGPGGYNC